jgi:peptidoglycan/LPS O-acetylase OafA/YrhL
LEGQVSDQPRHRSDVQGLRGIAVLLVVAYHAGVVFNGGFIGVDVFFVISGFVITLSLQRELERSERISLRAFYTRRIKRLLPALAVTLIVVAAVSALALSPFGPQTVAATTGIAASVFASNVYLYTSPSGYFGAPAELNPLLHMWSLSVEEQFYLVFPLLLVGCAAFARRFARSLQTTFAIVIGAGLAVSLAACVAITYMTPGKLGISAPVSLAFYAPVTRAWEFFAGALVAIALPGGEIVRGRLAGALGFVGAGAILAAALGFDSLTTFPGYTALVPVIGSVLLILGGSSAGPLSAALSSRPLVWVGDVSYGWYLWHWPMIVFAKMLFPDAGWAPPIAAVLSLVPTVVSYRTIENRIRFDSALRGRRVVALGVACVVVPLVALVGLRWGANNQWKVSSVRQTSAQLALHDDEILGCTANNTLENPACTIAPSGPSQGSIVLVGDSNAGHFTGALMGASESLQMTLSLSTSSACPFLSLTMSRPDVGYDEGCTERVKLTTARLIETRPDVVVIASASDLYLEESNALRAQDTNDVVTTADDKQALWASSLAATVDELTGAGIRVLVVNPVPRFWDLDPPTRCPMYKASSAATKCGSTRPLPDIVEELQAAVDAETEAVSGAGSQAATLNVVESLCPGDPCSTNDGNVWFFRDWAHISVGASAKLAPEFAEAIEALLA